MNFKHSFLIKSLLLLGSIGTSPLSFGQTLQEAIKLTNNEEFELADNVYKSLINSAPAGGAAYYYRGENFYDWGKPDSAQNSFEKGSAVNATEPLNFVGLGMIQLINGDTKNAEDNFYKAKILSKSKDPNVLDKIAEAYILAANKDVQSFQKAIDLLKEAITQEPKNPTFHIDMGDALLGQNPTDGSKAIEEYDKALSLDPKSVVAMIREGKLWKNARNYQTSYELFIKASKLDSNYAPAYREQAEMLYDAGRYDEAIAAYKKYLQLNNAFSARKRYGEFLLLSKKYDECISILNEIVSKDTTDPVVYRILGYAQSEKKDCPNGLINLNKFFRKVQGTKTKMLVTDYTYLGKLLSCVGQDSLAVIAMNQAINMMTDPKSPDACDLYSQIGGLYLKDRNYPLTVLYFQKKIQLCPQTPNSVNDYYYLGFAQYHNKQLSGADSSFSMVIKLNSTILIGYQWKAIIDEVIDSTCQTGSALPAINDFIKQVGNDTLKNKDNLLEAYKYCAIYYYNTKDKANSTLYCKKMLALDPDNQDAKNILANLNPKPVPRKEGKK
jgi:tetratricopeptide (TPR) repeat protein